MFFILINNNCYFFHLQITVEKRIICEFVVLTMLTYIKMASNVVQATMPGCQNSIAYVIKEIHFMILSCIIIDIYITTVLYLIN